jgi:hypothetical protein
MWSAYTGYQEVVYTSRPTGTGYVFDGSVGGSQTDGILTAYTIRDGSISYTTGAEPPDYTRVQTFVSALNVTAELPTTTQTKSKYQLLKTKTAEDATVISSTYTISTTTSTDPSTGSFYSSSSISVYIQTTSELEVNVTLITNEGGPTVATAFSRFDPEEGNTIYYYPDHAKGHYKVIHPRIGYPWTDDHQNRQFLQTFSLVSGTGDTNISTYVMDGTNTGGILNKVAENNTLWPRTLAGSITTIYWSSVYETGLFPTSGGTVTFVYEETEGFTYHSLTSTSASASILSRYEYDLFLSKFYTVPPVSSTFEVSTTIETGIKYTIKPQITKKLIDTQGGDDTYIDSQQFQTYENDGTAVYSYKGRTTRSIGGYWQERRVLTTIPMTKTYYHINSGLSGAYFQSLKFTGLGKTTKSTTQIDGIDTFYDEGTTVNSFLAYSGTILQGADVTYHTFYPWFSGSSSSFYIGLEAVRINRGKAFPDYDQPAVTTYAYSPNYNFAIGATYESSAEYNQYKNHGGYVEGIQPKSLLTKCFWSVYKFERTANINVPVLAYPINTESSDGSATTIQSVQVPLEFFNGSGTASIYVTTKYESTELYTSHTCCYGATESFKKMIIEYLNLDDISAGVLATASEISADIQIALTTLEDTYLPFGLNGYIGKMFYLNYPPIRYTSGYGESPHSAVGTVDLEQQPLFTILRTGLGQEAYPFDSILIGYLNSFAELQ